MSIDIEKFDKLPDAVKQEFQKTLYNGKKN